MEKPRFLLKTNQNQLWKHHWLGISPGTAGGPEGPLSLMCCGRHLLSLAGTPARRPHGPFLALGLHPLPAARGYFKPWLLCLRWLHLLYWNLYSFAQSRTVCQVPLSIPVPVTSGKPGAQPVCPGASVPSSAPGPPGRT